MKLKNNYKILSFILIFLSLSSFFLGFYLDENSAGGGLYTGDWKFAWPNLQIFLNNDISEGIIHENLLTNRTPLLYILHKLFNPFAGNEIGDRRSVFILSLITPVLFYLCIKQKFKKEDNLLLALIASTIFLSPYFRTSSYWGLEENYGLISLLFSFIFLNFFLENQQENNYKIYFQLFLSIFFSSLCIYFDQKLLIVPIICFLTIITSKKKNTLKVFSIFSYLILSFPYIYLITLWGGLFPAHITEARNLGNKLYFDHIGYAVTIIAFYFVPFLFFKKENIFYLVKITFSKKSNYYLFLLFFIYILSLIILSYFTNESSLNIDVSIGKGYIHKLSYILFEKNFIREIFIYFAFIISWIIILIFINQNVKDILILLYLFFVALITLPILQEYFDPLIFIMVFTFFNIKIFINYKNAIILFFYFSFFLISSNIYYYNLLN